MANQPKKYKKFVATAATATLVASAIVPVASAASLSDIAGNTHETAITTLVDAKIISGYADGTFKPNKTLTRSDVVKLLGKYLVTEGYSIPEDAVSSPRFSDLSSKSNKELLEYAAVVADAGVFAGSNGKLLAGDPITRENMAIVLVRMVNTLKDVSLEEYVDGQDFSKEVKDLNAAKAEARSAINVLDFYDITTATNFLPKNTVTRGQFATFLNNVIKADFAGASATTGTVTAINATTVEVKFGQEIKDIAALNFTIDGLEVKNAVIKQSDKTVAVLTTAAQEAGKSYTVKLNGNVVGKFVGISAVIPTAVNIVEKSLQEQVGKQVTLKAQVTVAEGQSKAGIPVTFNIVNTAAINTATLNQPIVAEAKTDENGVASYTYTRYAETSLQIASHDEVQAYATGNPTARSFSKVYWSSIKPLSLTEVTEGNAIQNGGKKVYKVTAALNHTETVTATEYAANTTYYNAKGIYGAGQYVNIGFEENTDVTPDKAVKTIDVIDASGRNLGYPGQYKSSTAGTNNLNSWVKEIKVKLDANGEAIFTLSGLDNAITPFVFVDQKVNPANDNGTSGRFEATELFSKAPKVTFAKQHTLSIGLDAVGEQFAAAFYNSNVVGKTLVHDGDYIANNVEKYLDRVLTADDLKLATVDAGGRDYKITVKDAKGQLAPIGTKVGIDIAIGSSQRTNGGAVYLVDNNTKKITKLTADAANNGKGVEYTNFNLLTTDIKGEVSFTLIGYKDAYATPTVVIDSGNELGKVDKNDQKFPGQIVYFSDARITKATLTASKTTTTSTDTVEYVYQTVDQNGKVYRPSLNSLDLNNPSVNNVPVTFQVSTTFNTVDVTAGKGITATNGYKFVNLNTNGPVTVGQDSMGNFGGIYETFTVIADEFGKASINVTGKGLGTTVNVTASTSLASLNQLLTASTVFGSTQVVSGYTGYVTDSAASHIQFEGEKSPLFYDAATAKFQLIGGATLTKAEFDAIVNKKDVKAYVQYKVDNGVTTFTILTVNGVAPTVNPGEVALTAAKKAAADLIESKYTAGSYATVTSAVATAVALPATATDTQKQAAANAIYTAINGLVEITAPGATDKFTITSKTATPHSVLTTVLNDYNIAGTIAADAGAVTAVKLVLVDSTNASTSDIDVTYNATARTFSYVASNAKAVKGILKAVDASGTVLSSTEITF